MQPTKVNISKMNEEYPEYGDKEQHQQILSSDTSEVIQKKPSSKTHSLHENANSSLTAPKTKVPRNIPSEAPGAKHSHVLENFQPNTMKSLSENNIFFDQNKVSPKYEMELQISSSKAKKDEIHESTVRFKNIVNVTGNNIAKLYISIPKEEKTFSNKWFGEQLRPFIRTQIYNLDDLLMSLLHPLSESTIKKDKNPEEGRLVIKEMRGLSVSFSRLYHTLLKNKLIDADIVAQHHQMCIGFLQHWLEQVPVYNSNFHKDATEILCMVSEYYMEVLKISGDMVQLEAFSQNIVEWRAAHMVLSDESRNIDEYKSIDWKSFLSKTEDKCIYSVSNSVLDKNSMKKRKFCPNSTIKMANEIFSSVKSTFDEDKTKFISAFDSFLDEKLSEGPDQKKKR